MIKCISRNITAAELMHTLVASYLPVLEVEVAVPERPNPADNYILGDVIPEDGYLSIVTNTMEQMYQIRRFFDEKKHILFILQTKKYSYFEFVRLYYPLQDLDTTNTTHILNEQQAFYAEIQQQRGMLLPENQENEMP
uniref:DUF4265 domain-containing protein n=1 Tax=Strongyloides papillosus TaxID=174720 RepID=A0A0N5BF25_STREA